MKSKITYRVMKMKEFEGNNPTVYYKLDCDCGDEAHVIMFELEHDGQDINLNLYQNIAWSAYYGSNSFFTRLKERIINSFKVLIFGHLEGQATLILSGEEHIQNFINALEEGKEYVKKS